MGVSPARMREIDEIRHVYFYVEGDRVFGCFYGDSTHGCEDWEIDPQDLIGYVIVDYAVHEDRIVFYAEWRG